MIHLLYPLLGIVSFLAPPVLADIDPVVATAQSSARWSVAIGKSEYVALVWNPINISGNGKWKATLHTGPEGDIDGVGGVCDATLTHPSSNYNGTTTLKAENTGGTTSVPFVLGVESVAKGAMGSSGTDNRGASSGINLSGSSTILMSLGTAGGSSGLHSYDVPDWKSINVPAIPAEEDYTILSGSLGGNAYYTHL